MAQARGGIREHVLCLAKLSDRQRFAISVCGPPEVRLISELRQAETEFVPLPHGLWGGGVLAARRLLNRGFDLVHSHGYRASLLASLAVLVSAPRAQICTVHTLLGEEAFQGIGGRLKRRVANWALGRCATVVAVSRAVASNIEQHLPQLGDRIHTIYNGIDLSQIRPATMKGFLAASLGFDPNLPVAGTVARLSPEKGVHVLLKAAKILADSGVAVQYVIVGDGPERAQLERMVHRLGLTAQVRFMGERQDVSQLISLFDVLVVPSLSEAFSLVAVMGGMLGVPVVASRDGGIEEVLEPEMAAFVPPGDAKSLAQAVLGVLQGGQRQSGLLAGLLQEMATPEAQSLFQKSLDPSSLFEAYDISDEAFAGLNLDDSPRGRARRLLLKRFDARRMVQETNSLYDSVLENTGG